MDRIMKRGIQRFGIALAIALFGLMSLGGLLHLLGARINVSPSIPVGLYWRADAPVARGAYVMFCPPQIEVFRHALQRGYLGSGWCPGGYGYVMKKVAGATGDVVEVADDGLRINGVPYPKSALLRLDGQGRPLPRFQTNRYTLSEFQLLLMSDAHPRSFDGRYFGPIQRRQVKEVIVPVLTWESSE